MRIIMFLISSGTSLDRKLFNKIDITMEIQVKTDMKQYIL